MCMSGTISRICIKQHFNFNAELFLTFDFEKQKWWAVKSMETNFNRNLWQHFYNLFLTFLSNFAFNLKQKPKNKKPDDGATSMSIYAFSLHFFFYILIFLLFSILCAYIFFLRDVLNSDFVLLRIKFCF